MIVGLLAVIVVLEVALAAACVRGFDSPSVVEWYADRKAERRRRLYTLSRRTRVLA